MSPPKTVRDLPHFRVAAVKQGETHEGEMIDFELSGRFDRGDGIKEGRGSLLFSDKDGFGALIGTLTFVEGSADPVRFRISEKSMPDVVGSSLPYLDYRWEPHHVWMVAEPKWIWNRTFFKSIDAISRRVQSEDITILAKQEVREWLEIKKAGQASSLSRYYPVLPDHGTTLPPAGEDGIIKDGWDHEHCELCTAHIEAETYGYLDLGGHWICEECYEKYVVNHDLSFVSP